MRTPRSRPRFFWEFLLATGGCLHPTIKNVHMVGIYWPIQVFLDSMYSYLTARRDKWQSLIRGNTEKGFETVF